MRDDNRTKVVAPPTVSAPTVSSDAKAPPVVIGIPERWIVLSKAYSLHEGWMRSVEAMAVPGGCLVRTTSRQRSGVERGTPYIIAEALAFVPYVHITEDMNGGHQLAGPYEGMVIPHPSPES